MKLLIIGDGRHGKDTVAEIIRDEFAMEFESSSRWCLHRAIMPATGDTLPLYRDADACYADRINHRFGWKRLISEYNNPKDRLVTEILEVANMYVGLRKRDEFDAAAHHFDHVLWVDRSNHLPPEPSNELMPSDADFVIDNNGDLDSLRFNTVSLIQDLERFFG